MPPQPNKKFYKQAIIAVHSFLMHHSKGQKEEPLDCLSVFSLQLFWVLLSHPQTLLMMEGGRREEEEEEEGGLVELLLSSPSSSTTYSSSMFCFIGEGQVEAAQRSSTDSSLSSSPSNSTMTTCFNASVKEEEINGGMSWSDHGSNKRTKRDGPGSKGMIKVRKERLGERIAALQQLVSPFGKSDTASVLHEALAYIRFLHDQVQVLSSPYMQRLPSTASLQKQGKKEEAGPRKLGDLESRGLCLVPLSCTLHVANTNGADLWAHSHSNLGPTSNSTSPPKPSSF